VGTGRRTYLIVAALAGAGSDGLVCINLAWGMISVSMLGQLPGVPRDKGLVWWSMRPADIQRPPAPVLRNPVCEL